ncbi:SusC/RagA family TonB-linked outer membrane protein [Pedobacter sp. GR22-6]|uniref:SusC/RagA family TonB-linked outer membrane protein n=1 Tax=Pedobacter sp. GR22-6 TaxID=3127957 RepID=UPI00307F4C55
MNLSLRRIFRHLLYLAVFLFLLTDTVRAQQITLTKNEYTLSELFSEIRRQNNYDFIFTTPQFNSAKKVFVKTKSAQLTDLLDNIFANQQISYVIQNKTIVITDNKAKTNNAIKKEEVINGFVGTKNGKVAISGVNVTVKGTNMAVETKNDGRFSIKVPTSAAALIFSKVGYKTVEVSIGPNSDYNVAMDEDQQTLKDIVITGTGIVKKAGTFSGAATTITGSELKAMNTNNIFAGISALDPSFRILQDNIAGGNINTLPNIQIRGQNQLPNLGSNFNLDVNPNLPLFVLDGFEVSLDRVFNLDMNMVESVTLLKDASSTSIYGSRGANGVMVVTTITPKPGKLIVSLTHDFRLNTPVLSGYDMLNSEEKLDFERRAGLYSSGANGRLMLLDDQLYKLRSDYVARGIDTKWYYYPVQNGASNRTSLNLQGGDAVVRYNVQLTTDLMSGVMKGQDRKNYQGNMNLSYNVKKIQLSNNTNITQTFSNESPYRSFSNYVTMNPYWTPYDEDGGMKRYVENEVLSNTLYQTANPLYDAGLNSINSANSLSVTNNTSMRFIPGRNFFIETSLSLRREKNGSDQFFSGLDSQFASQTDLSRRGSYTIGNATSTNIANNTVANLVLDFNRHQVTLSGRAAVSSNTRASNTMVAEGFPTDQLDNILFAAQYQPNSRPTGFESIVRNLTFTGSGNYSFDSRLFVDASLTRDGGSTYGTDNKFGTFWSTGIGWNLHNEKFITNKDLINILRLRTNYGYRGSMNQDASASQFRYNLGTGTSYYGAIGSTLAGMANPNLTWSKTKTLNLGLNAVLLRNRLNLTLDAYRDNTEGAIMAVSIAPSTGFTNYAENIGTTQNTGFEFTVNYQILNNAQNRLRWTVSLNGSRNKNILKEMSDALRIANEILTRNNAAQNVPNQQFQVGQSMSALYVVPSLGIDPATGWEVFKTLSGERTYVWSGTDKVSVGDTNPKWNGNFGSNLMYKGWTVNVNFGYRFGAKLYNSTLLNRVENVNPRNNVDRRAYELGWTQPGDVTQYRRISAISGGTQLTSRFVQTDNTIVLSTLNLGYNFSSSSLIKRLGLASLDLLAGLQDEAVRFSSVQYERGTANPFSRGYNFTLRARL